MTSDEEIEGLLRSASAGPRTNVDPARAIRRGTSLARRRRAYFATGILGSFILGMLVWSFVPDLTDSRAPIPEAADSQTAPNADPSETRDLGITRTNLTPEIEVASGTLGGLPYSLNAQVALVKGMGQNETMICTDWTYGPAPGTGSDCESFDPTEPHALAYTVDQSNVESGQTPIFGIVGQGVERVTVELVSGRAVEVDLVGPFKDLDFPVRFLVAGVKVSDAAAITALDAQDNVLVRRQLP